MKQPHIHAALIHAWADGAPIQYSFEGENWYDCTSQPQWNPGTQYRVVPAPFKFKYRKYLYKNVMDDIRVGVANLDSSYAPEKDMGFVKWIDNDWIEMEIAQ